MYLFNPCKHCITRAMCRKTCNDFDNYGERVYNFIFLSFTISLGVFLIFIIIFTQLIISTSFVYGIVFTLCVLGYGYSFKEIKNDYNFKGYKLWEKIILYIFGPYLFLSSSILVRLSVDKHLDDFLFKYNKKLHPKIYD